MTFKPTNIINYKILTFAPLLENYNFAAEYKLVWNKDPGNKLVTAKIN